MSLLRRFRTSSKSPRALDSDTPAEWHRDLELYKIAMDEYRFQVNLNWNRTQYSIVLNLGILGLATGLFRGEVDGTAVVGIGLYVAGIVCCVLSLIAGRVQRGYYRRTKEHKALLERRLALGDLAITTTTGMGSTAHQLAKVTTLHIVLLSLLLLLDAGGLSNSIIEAAG